MVQALPIRQNITKWVDICPISAIAYRSLCFSKAFVLSRGIVGERNGIAKVASPIYKQNFSLITGQCLDDETVRIPTFTVRVVEDTVQVAITEV